jgi:hypothetical protein
MAEILVKQHRLPLKLALNLLELPRSTYYYRSQKRDESQLEADLGKVAGQYPTYGTRRMTSSAASSALSLSSRPQADPASDAPERPFEAGQAPKMPDN